MSDKSLQELMTDLATLTEALRQADQQEAMARQNRVSVLNRLNAAQKAIDAHMAKIRKSAARDTDWGRDAG